MALHFGLVNRIAACLRPLRASDDSPRELENVLRHLETEHQVSPEDMLSLRCLILPGSFGGFPVNGVRVYNYQEAHKRGAIVNNFHDLNEYPDLIAFEGYILRGGLVHLRRPQKKSPVGTKAADQRQTVNTPDG